MSAKEKFVPKFPVRSEIHNAATLDPSTGRVEQSQRRSSRTYSFRDLADLGEYALTVFEQLSIRISPYSSLSRLVNGAVALADEWERNPQMGVEEERLARANYAGSICEAIIHARHDPQVAKVLPRLTSGSLDPLSRETSRARDAAWELQIRQLLSEHGIEARLDEPDVVVDLESGSLGVACKKLYREGHAVNRIATGISQLNGSPGIVAVNLDDLLRDRILFLAPSPMQLLDALNSAVGSFLSRHERKLIRYLEEGRVSAYLLSISAYGRCPEGVQEGRQFLMWAHPKMPSHHAPLVEELRVALGTPQE